MSHQDVLVLPVGSLIVVAPAVVAGVAAVASPTLPTSDGTPFSDTFGDTF